MKDKKEPKAEKRNIIQKQNKEKDRNEIETIIEELNSLSKEHEYIYHELAVRSHLSDSVFWIFYVLLTSGDGATQKEISEGWSYSKQTIHSAIQKMRDNQWIEVEDIPGSRVGKKVLLTKEGKEFSEKTVGIYVKAEKEALSRIPIEELRSFIDIYRKEIAMLTEEIKTLQRDVDIT